MHGRTQHEVVAQGCSGSHELSNNHDRREVAVPSSEEQAGNTTGLLRVFGCFLIFVNIWSA